MATDAHEPVTFVCWGELLWDLFPDGARLGGAPCNVAVHLTQLGHRAALITSLGQDALGDDARQALRERGLSLRGVQGHKSLPTGRVGIEVVDGEASYTLHDGAWWEIACDDAARSLLAEAKVLVYGTLSQEHAFGLASWRSAIAASSASCIKICDPNLRGGRIAPALVREHIQAANIVKINDDELASIERTYGQRDGIRWLLDNMDLDCVAHTHGALGATLYARDGGHANHPGFQASPGGDNIGAGDAFTAVLAITALRATPLAQAVEAANRVAAFVASSRGATPVLPATLLDEVAALLGRNRL